VYSIRRSGNPYFRNAIRSMPIPNAKPCHSSVSSPAIASTFWSTSPAPRISIQPECLHTTQPAPSHRKQDTSTSTLGSVNGKKLVRNRVSRSAPNSDRAKYASVPLRSPSVMPRSTTRPSTWWKIGECVASGVSRRYTRPGTIT